MLLSLTFLVLALHVTGLPAAPTEECNQPLWTVVGNHYALNDECGTKPRFNFRHEDLRQTFTSVLASGERKRNDKDLERTVDMLMDQWKPLQYSMVDDMMCVGCVAGVNTYRMLTKLSLTPEELLKIFDMLCVKLNVMTPPVCEGVLNAYGRTLTSVVDLSNRTSEEICAFLLNPACQGPRFPETVWDVPMPPKKKPPVTDPTPLPGSVKNLKVLHLTDTHWDTKYVEGTWAECKLPLCCREETPLPDKGAARAGKYGGWKCDIPEATFDDMLSHVAQKHPDLDYVLWTGDIPPHDIWDQGRNDNIDILRKTVAKLKAAFPKTPIFPALGNHESVPPNMFPVADRNTAQNPMSWLYHELNVEWTKWLPKDVSSTVEKGAFYTTLVRPGLRLVSMNMNYCYSLNWWLILQSVDPLQELQWFAKLLQESEDKGEVVHVIGHIPPGNSDCLKMWQTNYYKIISRYESTVTAQFFGHTHYDKFELYYDVNNADRPVGVGYVAPSLTTYTYLNPTYRVYYVEGDAKNSKRYVVDHETWYMDLEKSNRDNKSHWSVLYTAKKAFNMTDLYPKSWHQVYNNMVKSKNTLELYNKYYWCGSPRRPQCDDACRLDLLCGVRSCAQYGLPKPT